MRAASLIRARRSGLPGLPLAPHLRPRRGRDGGLDIAPSRLLAADVLRVASVGLRTRRLRAALSALGVAIGIAAMVAVLGISDSSKAGLVAELNELGPTC
ncbi:MAG: ABC transporter permease [Solirubrobacteraceae bacterium]